MKKVYAIDSEWDLGVDDQLYPTEDEAWDALQDAYLLQEMDENYGPFEKAKEDGLVWVSEKELR